MSTTVDHVAIVRALVDGVRHGLGDVATCKKYGTAQLILMRQVNTLVGLDPRFGEAVRQVVEEKLCRLIASPEAREKVVVDYHDPDHIYWLLVVPDNLVRRLARQRAQEVNPEEMFTRMAGMSLIGQVFRMERPPQDGGPPPGE